MFCPCAFQFQLAHNAHRRKVPCITMCPCDFDSVTFWNLLEPSGIFWNLLEPSGTLELQTVHRRTDIH